MTANDKSSKQAAAELRWLAQSRALIRMYQESKRHPELLGGEIQPTDADIEAVNAEHPELVLLAARGNPFLPGDGR